MEMWGSGDYDVVSPCENGSMYVNRMLLVGWLVGWLLVLFAFQRQSRKTSPPPTSQYLIPSQPRGKYRTWPAFRFLDCLALATELLLLPFTTFGPTHCLSHPHQPLHRSHVLRRWLVPLSLWLSVPLRLPLRIRLPLTIPFPPPTRWSRRSRRSGRPRALLLQILL